MFWKSKNNDRAIDQEKTARKSRENNSGRKTWGFSCSPDISAQMKILADRIHVPLFGLAEHAMQLSAGLIARLADNPEQCDLLRMHIIENHVKMRTIEKIDRYDQEMGDILYKERQRQSQIENLALKTVAPFLRAGHSPEDIKFFIKYGIDCCYADTEGKPRPRSIG